tara:strand:- start:152 stop:538 length:387 start_codon:yes stop_codon:yes gene_type:complete
MTTDWDDYPNFHEYEFRCNCGCGKADMAPAFMALLQATRTAYGKPMTITSGYRCPEYNTKVSSTGMDGPHTSGKAVDVSVSRKDAHALLALSTGVYSGIGIQQKGVGRFIHLDTLTPDEAPRPTIWSY